MDFLLRICLYSLLLFSFSVNIVFSDEIFLVNGESAKTEIVDTNGCEVKILRNGNNVSINKNAINKIIWKNHTLSFIGYKCPEKSIIAAVKYNETPEYQLIELLDKATARNRYIRNNSRIAFINVPLNGNYNSDEFNKVQADLIDFFKNKSDVSMITPQELLDECTSSSHHFDYAFIAKKYHIEKNSASELNVKLYTVADFILFDISRKQITFHKTMVEKRHVFLQFNETGSMPLLMPLSLPLPLVIANSAIPQDVKDKIEKNQTNRSLDNSASSIIEELKAALLNFFKS